MGTSDTTGTMDRLDRWLGEQFDGVFRRKQRLEALYCEKRARRAEDRGNLEDAEDYYDRARSLRGKLGDREATIDLSMRHATVARENGNFGVARKYFERVVELHARKANAPEALDAAEEVIDIAERQADADGREEWWGHAMMLLGKAEPDEIDDERQYELVEGYADAVHTEDSAGRLYGFGVQRLADATDAEGSRTWSNDEAAAGADLVDEAWDRNDVVREEVAQFQVLLAAGLGRVAYAELTDRDVDREAILSLAADNRERLSQAADALFERLSEGETDVAPEQLRPDELEEPAELGDVEAEVFGRFLEDL